MIDGFAYRMVSPGQPLERQAVQFAAERAGDVVVRVVGCGICHTDIGFLHDGVRTRKALPLALGHEVVGEVIEGALAGKLVVVPAVMPCGECHACRTGHSGTCAIQAMPGNDIDGGFASHIVVPARYLQVVPERGAIEAWQYAAAADAGSTAWAAVVRCKVGEGDTAVVIGAGGVGGFAAQVARVKGARVLSLDVDEARLAELATQGGVDTLCTRGMEARDVRNAVSSRLGKDRWGWRILECSGTPAGQETAFNLLGPAGVLGVIGFTPKPVSVRLSNLMAFEAEAVGSWGCPPELYPEVIGAMAAGSVKVAPFVESFPMADVNDVLERVHHGGISRRPILVN